MKRPFIEAFSGSHHNGSSLLEDPRYQRADDEGYTLDWVKDASVELVAGTATALAHGFWSVLGQCHHIFVANVLDQEQIEPKRAKLESEDDRGVGAAGGSHDREDAKHPVESFLPKHNYTRTPTRSQLHPIMGNALSKVEDPSRVGPNAETRPKLPVFELETRQLKQPQNLLKAAVNNRIAPVVEDKDKPVDVPPGTLTPMLRKTRISYSPDVTPSFKTKLSHNALAKIDDPPLPNGTYGTSFELKKSGKPDIMSTKGWAHKFIESHNGTYQRPAISDSRPEPYAPNERKVPFGALLGSRRRSSLYGDIHNDRLKLEKRREEEARLKSKQSDEEQFPSGVDLNERRKFYDQLVKRHRKVLDDVRGLREQKDIKPKDTPFTPLSPIQVKEIEQYWRQPRQTQRIVVTAFKIEVSLADLQTLKDREWLNDNIIDYYLSMVTLRSAEKSFSFSTHFFTTLQQKGYQGVARWAKKKKIDVRKLDYVFVPINRSNTHWCLAVINNVDKKFQFYDSMGGVGKPALSLLREYMVSECERLDPGQHEKYRTLYDSYKLCDKLDCPQQHNGSDCGVFTCKMVEVLSRNKSFGFSQKDMPGIRRKMAYEILHQKLI